MKKPKYKLRKIGKRGKFEIWEVDGNLIRTELEKEFTNFGQHFQFHRIPKYEFWLDRENAPDERNFFIDHLLLEWSKMKEGATHREAIVAADDREMKERIKALGDKRFSLKTEDKLLPQVYKRKLKNTKKGIQVYLIDGKLVRTLFYIDFTEGGHDLVYKFVPENQVWIDNDIVPKERKYIIIHELYERSLMRRGLTYNQAHEKASALEWECRHRQKKCKEVLNKLGYK